MTFNNGRVKCRSLDELSLLGKTKASSNRHASSIDNRCSEVTQFDSIVTRTHVACSGEVSQTTHRYSSTKQTSSIEKLVLGRSVSSPAAAERSDVNNGGIIKDGNRKIKRRDRVKSEWKIKDRHVSFDECVHVLTKCAVIEMPLKNSAWLPGNSRSNGCNVCGMVSTRDDGKLLERTVHFSWEEMLQAAVIDQDLSEVKRICQQRGTCFNKKLSNGLTLLHLASIHGCFRVVQYVLKHCCQVDEKDENGWTALHYAVLHSNVPCALALLRAGADTHVRTGDSDRNVIELASTDEMILLLGRMMHCGNNGGGELSKHKINDHKETYV